MKMCWSGVAVIAAANTGKLEAITVQTNNQRHSLSIKMNRYKATVKTRKLVEKNTVFNHRASLRSKHSEDAFERKGEENQKQNEYQTHKAPGFSTEHCTGCQMEATKCFAKIKRVHLYPLCFAFRLILQVSAVRGSVFPRNFFRFEYSRAASRKLHTRRRIIRLPRTFH
ncbi:Biorientation Of Chromosomes In Cell Division Protein 1-Like 1 [Manis pentadactyla]|nr:Biorientation Of Chromosomes In Cell Division Protein 1-Like 1 [Manis pentadactyla]